MAKKVGTTNGMNGTNGDDFIFGTAGDDRINGLGGHDFLFGESGNDRLSGGDGFDGLDGGAGNDELFGDAGNDNLSDFGGGHNRLSGGTGDDVINSSFADSLWIDGGAGADEIRGDASGAVTVIAGAGNDLVSVSSVQSGHVAIDGGDGDDTLQAFTITTGSVNGGAGNDLIIVQGGAYTIDGGAGNDTINLRSSSPAQHTVATGDGADIVRLRTPAGDPVVITDFDVAQNGDRIDFRSLLEVNAPSWDSSNPFGASGYLRLVQSGKDTLLQFDTDGAGGPNAFHTVAILKGVKASKLTGAHFEPGFDPSGAAPGGLTLIGTADADTLLGGIGNDTISGLEGDDTLGGFEGHDHILGGGGRDDIRGHRGNDILDGGDGDDVLIDSSDHTVYIGGAGNDMINGGSGTAVVDAGDGRDRVRLFGMTGPVEVTTGEGIDNVLVSGAGPISIDTGIGDDIVSVTAHDSGVFHTISTGEGDDRIDGTNVAGTIDAGAGNDEISVAPAFGGTTIATGEGADLVRIVGFTGYTLTVTDFTAGAGGDVLDLQQVMASTTWDSTQGNPFGASGYLRVGVDGSDTRVELDIDGSGNGENYVTIALLRNTTTAALTSDNFTPAYDPFGAPGRVVSGTENSDSLSGGPGDDQIFGFAGNDGLFGGAGNDHLDGGDDDDFLSDSEGHNYLLGGSGNDTLDSSSALSATLDGSDGNDTITASNSGDTTIIGGEGNDGVNVVGGGVTFVNAGAGDDTLNLAFAAAATVNMDAGNDTVYVNGGPVMLDAGSGQDYVAVFYTGSPQTITLGLGDRDTLVLQNFASEALVVTDFEAGGGGDLLSIASILFSLSNWDFSSNPFLTGHVRFLQSGGDTLFQVDFDGGDNGESFFTAATLQNVTASALTAHNLEPSYDPAGGTGGTTIDGSDDPENIMGTAGDDTINGLGGNDELYPYLGNDTVNGGEGNDLIVDQGGNDTLNGEAGNDNITDNTGISVIDGGDGDDILSSIGAESITINGGEGYNQYYVADAGYATVFGGTGIDWLQISGSGSGSFINLGDGDNSASILSGYNTHIFHSGVGNDTITSSGWNYVYSGDGNDTVDLYGGRTNLAAGGGDDRLNLWYAEAAHTVETGSGVDTLVVQTHSSNLAIVTDFTVGAGGDVIDLQGLLTPPEPASPLGDYVTFADDGLDTTVAIDVDGAEGGAGFVDALLLQGVTGYTAEQFVGFANLLV